MTNYPAPWSLSGRGYLILYRFKEEFVNQQGNVPPFLHNQFAGGWGSMMLVDYQSSNAGPYQELLFIPGRFHHHGRRLNTITKIYVSTQSSVDNGRRNWAIPKELAHFDFRRLARRKEQITVSKNGQTILQMNIGTDRLPFPVTTKLFPLPLVQSQDDIFYYTKFMGSGQGRLAQIDHLLIDPQGFPDISAIKPLMAVAIDPFHIVFPIAKTEKHQV